MSTSKIESALQNFSSCELPTPMLNDTFQHSSLNTTITAAATATTIQHSAVFQQQDTNALRLQFKTKEQTWNKDKAILEQKIELLESHIYESRIRQENLQKMNEAFMTALHDLTENPKNFSNKMLKELQQLFDGKKGCTEHEQQLLKNTSTIKSQRIELEELRARVNELEDELAENTAAHEVDCDNLRQFCQSEIQSMQIQQAGVIEEATKEKESSGNEVIRLKNVIEALTANHKMEVEMLQTSRGSQMEEEMKGRIEESMALNSCNSRFSEDKSIQQLNQSWQEKLQQQQQQFIQQQYQLQQQLQQQQQQQQQYAKMIDALQKEKTQLGGQLQSVATQLQTSQDQNTVISQALNSSQGQLEELKQKMNTHTSPSFPNTYSEFFDAELQISRIEPDRVKRRSIMNESLLSSFLPTNTPVSSNNNGKMFPLHNASSNENFSNSTNSSGKNYTQIPCNNGVASNMISSFNHNEHGQKQNFPLQQQEMHISDLNPSNNINNNNMNSNNQYPNNNNNTQNNVNNNAYSIPHGVMIRQGSMSGSEMSNCDTFGFPSGVKNTNTFLRGQSNSAHKSPNEFTPNIPNNNNTAKAQLQQLSQQDKYDLANIQQQQQLQQQQLIQGHFQQVQQKQQQNHQMTHSQQQHQQQQQQYRFEKDQSEQEYPQQYQDQQQPLQHLAQARQQHQLQQQQYQQKGQSNSQQQILNSSSSWQTQQHSNPLKESLADKRSQQGSQSIQSQLQQLQQQSQQQYQQSQHLSKRSPNINSFNSGDRQMPNQTLKTEDASTRRTSNSVSFHGQGSLSCTNLQSIGQIADNHLNNNSKNQGSNPNSNNDNCSTHSSNCNQSQVLQKISRNGLSSHSSSSSILNQQKINSSNSKNQPQLNGSSLKQQSIRNSSCNNPQKAGQENYPQPYVRQSNSQFVSSKQLSYPKSCSQIETTQTNTANSHVFEQGILSNIHSNPGNPNSILETQFNQSTRNSSINKNIGRDSNVLSQSMVSGVSQQLVSQSMMLANGNISQSVSMGRANNTNNYPMSQSSLLNQDQSFLVRAINENMNERMSLEEKMKNLESEVNNYVALTHPKTKSSSSSSLPDQQLVQLVMKELYAKQLSRNIFQLAKEEREAVLRAEIKILVDKVLMNKPLRQHSHDSHNSILNHSLNKSILTAAEDTHLHGGLRESKSPRYNSNTSSTTTGSLLHSTILSAKASSSAALKPNSNIFGKIQIKPSSATHFQQQLEGLQGQHFFDKKIRQPLTASSANSRN